MEQRMANQEKLSALSYTEAAIAFANGQKVEVHYPWLDPDDWRTVGNFQTFDRPDVIFRLLARTEAGAVCDECDGKGVVPIGDGYSVSPCGACYAHPQDASGDADIAMLHDTLRKIDDLLMSVMAYMLSARRNSRGRR